MAENNTQVTMNEELLHDHTSTPPMGWEVIRREFARDKIAVLSLIILMAIVGAAIASAFFIDSQDAGIVNIFDRFTPPGEKGYILGTDEGGKGILEQLLLGTKNSLIIAWAVTILTAGFGTLIGLIAGYYGGRVDDLIMRVVDFLIVLPRIMIIIAVVTIVKRFDPWTLIWIISLFGWMGQTRLIRTASLSEASKDYIKASKTMGTRDWKIMLGSLLPNLSSLMITNLTLSFAGNIGLETGLSFLGFGLPIGTPSLGTLIGYARTPDIIENKWWVWLPAALLVLVMMLSINYIGQAFQRVADSKQRRG
ncbi:ABC transporter permease [Facklamia miroungae]|uniref:Peptide/nickel transport system permease protein n=1 Tax=Facklamia miroungae TaxID=120956 RepID=A0A1G7PPV1_9LACT|nr:ABC transporter permease [Facklamia miroungae]NKZ28784.1 ABC transporter permease [Facklamia miroungae]SDF88254.1 peptide/nickel transport system permease protein [Facklamia miroungae]